MSTSILRSSEPLRPLPSKGGMPGWRLARTLAHMRDHLAEDVAMADLAAAAGLSRAQFFRAFKQSTGVTPGRYLTLLRLESARDAMDAGLHDAEGAAKGAGLGPAGFSCQFRRHFGMTPRAYAARRTRVTSAAGADRP